MIGVADTGKAYDLVFVGGGVSATATLTSLVEVLRPERRPLKVAVIDRAGAFGGGLTYSGPSAGATLMQNPVSMMPERLSGLLRTADESWLTDWCDAAGPGAAHWRAEFRPDISEGRIDGLFVPRGLYGFALSDALDRATAGAWPGLEIGRLQAGVTAVKRSGDGYRLIVDGVGGPLDTRLLVLAPGMIPSADAEGAIPYIDRSPEAFVAELAERCRHGSGQICILGANAATMDVLHLLASYRPLLPEQARIVVVAPTGGLPVPLGSGGDSPPPSRVLQGKVRFETADDLAEAVRLDARDRRLAGYAQATLTEEGAAAAILKALQDLAPGEQKRLLQFHGHVLARISRRAVPAYHRSAKSLESAGILTVLRARVTETHRTPRNWTVRLDGPLHDLDVSAVVDCRGGGNLFSTLDPLLQSLTADRETVVGVNDAGSGLDVNDSFAAAPGLFVMGDLLTGYSGANGVIWHLQNAPRIETYSQVLGAALAAELGRGAD